MRKRRHGKRSRRKGGRGKDGKRDGEREGRVEKRQKRKEHRRNYSAALKKVFTLHDPISRLILNRFLVFI